MSSSTTAPKRAIKALPFACDDTAALSSPQNVRADCIAYKYLRRCQGSRFLNDPVCTSLGYQRPGFAFACINRFCTKSAAGSPQCNDWMNYIQMIANAERDDAVVPSDRVSAMGSKHYNKDNEAIGLREFWFCSDNATHLGGRACNKDIDYTIGGRVPSNAGTNYDTNVKPSVFYPVEYDRKMRSSDVCNTSQDGSSTPGVHDPDEVWGSRQDLENGTVLKSIFGKNQYHTIPADAINKTNISIKLKHPFRTSGAAANNDAVYLIKSDMSEDASIPSLKRGVDYDVSSDGKELTLRLQASGMLGRLRSGNVFALVRHGGGRGCRCLRADNLVSLASDDRMPYRKECVYGFCNTTHVNELAVSARNVVHYPRRDYLSARDGTFVNNTVSTSNPPCPSQLTICETNLTAGDSIIIDKQSRIVNRCQSSSSSPSSEEMPDSTTTPATSAGPASSPAPPASTALPTTDPAPSSSSSTTTPTPPSDSLWPSATPSSSTSPAQSTTPGTTPPGVSLKNMSAQQKKQLTVVGVSSSCMVCLFAMFMFGTVMLERKSNSL